MISFHKGDSWPGTRTTSRFVLLDATISQITQALIRKFKKMSDSIVRWRDLLLQYLASHDNVSNGFSPGAEAGDREKLNRTLDKTKCEIVQALKILA
jgi:hypothetical protein